MNRLPLDITPFEEPIRARFFIYAPSSVTLGIRLTHGTWRNPAPTIVIDWWELRDGKEYGCFAEVSLFKTEADLHDCLMDAAEALGKNAAAAMGHAGTIVGSASWGPLPTIMLVPEPPSRGWLRKLRYRWHCWWVRRHHPGHRVGTWREIYGDPIRVTDITEYTAPLFIRPTITAGADVDIHGAAFGET